ncbi:hypothetical protein [Sphingomonas koreensis]
MQRFHYASGAAIALFAAGPLFLLPMMFISGVGLMVFFAMPIAIPIGAMIAAIPVIGGGFLMGWLGVRNEAMRNPVAWGGAGALLALVIAAMFGATQEPALIGLFLFPGISCALLVRYGTRWSDDSV